MSPFTREPDALMSDVGVDRVCEVDRGRAARERFHVTFRRETKDVLGVEVHFQLVQELVRVVDLVLPVDDLPKPREVLDVVVFERASLLVLPVGGDALLGDAVHLRRSDLNFEGYARVRDHARVE